MRDPIEPIEEHKTLEQMEKEAELEIERVREHQRMLMEDEK